MISSFILPSKRLVRLGFLGFVCRWSSDRDCSESEPKKISGKLSGRSGKKPSGDNYHHLQKQASPRDNPPKPLCYHGRSLSYSTPGQGALTHHLSFWSHWSGTHNYKPEKTDSTVSLIVGIDATNYILRGPKFSKLLKKIEVTEDTYLALWFPHLLPNMFPPRKHSPAHFYS